MRADWARRCAALRAEFEGLEADLITLQETIFTRDHDQAREMLGNSYHLVHQTEREVDGQGITTPAGGQSAGPLRSTSTSATAPMASPRPAS